MGLEGNSLRGEKKGRPRPTRRERKRKRKRRKRKRRRRHQHPPNPTRPGIAYAVRGAQARNPLTLMNRRGAGYVWGTQGWRQTGGAQPRVVEAPKSLAEGGMLLRTQGYLGTVIFRINFDLGGTEGGQEGAKVALGVQVCPRGSPGFRG